MSFTGMETESKNLVFTVNQTTKFVPNPEPREYYLPKERCPWRELEANKSQNPELDGKVFIEKNGQYGSVMGHRWKMRTKPCNPL